MPTSEDPQIEARRTRLRQWYSKAIERKEEEFGGQSPIRDLDYDHLFSEIRKYDQSTFFGGASLTILQELLEKEAMLGRKVRYFQQGGAFNRKLNILGNSYNIALNTKAAEYVFKHQDKLRKFTLIPTDTTKRVEWTVQGLVRISPAVGVRSLAFHGRYDAWEMISAKERDGKPHSTQESLARRADVHDQLRIDGLYTPSGWQRIQPGVFALMRGAHEQNAQGRELYQFGVLLGRVRVY